MGGSLLSLEYTAGVPDAGSVESVSGKLLPRELLSWLPQPLQVAYSDMAPSPMPPQPPFKTAPSHLLPLHFTTTRYHLPIWSPVCTLLLKQSSRGTGAFICLRLSTWRTEALNKSAKGIDPICSLSQSPGQSFHTGGAQQIPADKASTKQSPVTSGKCRAGV